MRGKGKVGHTVRNAREFQLLEVLWSWLARMSAKNIYFLWLLLILVIGIDLRGKKVQRVADTTEEWQVN